MVDSEPNSQPPSIPSWDLAPETPLSIGVIGSDIEVESLRDRLPPSWIVFQLRQVGSIAVHRCHLICIVRSRRSKGDAEEIIQRVQDIAIPVVVLLADLSPVGILGIRNINVRKLLIHGIDEKRIIKIIRDVAVRPVFDCLQSRIRSHLSQNMILRSTLCKVVGQVPNPVSVAVEKTSKGERVFYRKVKDLPMLAGVSRSHLQQQAKEFRVSLSEFLRRNTILHGMALYNSGNSRDVAYRLGYETVEAWRAFVRRQTGEPLKEMRRMPLGFHAMKVLRTLES